MNHLVNRVVFLIICFIVIVVNLFALNPSDKYELFLERYALVYKEIPVTTSDGLRIKCWFFPAQEPVNPEEWYKVWTSENPLGKEYVLKYAEP